jgi:hypothetical protein
VWDGLYVGSEGALAEVGVELEIDASRSINERHIK